MLEENPSYVLDFIIPMGATGSVGDAGPIGSTGPINDAEPIIFSEYEDTNTAGTLTLASTTIVPENSSIYRKNENLIYTDLNGQYEYTLSGCLMESSIYNGATLILNAKVQNSTRNLDLITVTLNEGIEKSYFSVTKIAISGYQLELSVILNKSNNSDASVQDLNLIIKRIPFAYNV